MKSSDGYLLGLYVPGGHTQLQQKPYTEGYKKVGMSFSYVSSCFDAVPVYRRPKKQFRPTTPLVTSLIRAPDVEGPTPSSISPPARLTLPRSATILLKKPERPTMPSGPKKDRWYVLPNLLKSHGGVLIFCDRASNPPESRQTLQAKTPTKPRPTSASSATCKCSCCTPLLRCLW